MTTRVIDQWQEQGEALLRRPVAGEVHWCLAAAALAMAQGAGWRANSVAAFGMSLRCDEVQQVLRVQPDRHGSVQVTLGAATHQLRILSQQAGRLRFEMDGVIRSAVAVHHQQALHLALDGAVFVFSEVSAFPDSRVAQDATRALAPVAGKVTQIQVMVGDVVQEGQSLLCVEAMKMEMWVSAQAAGTVKALHTAVGEQVESGALLIDLEIASNKDT